MSERVWQQNVLLTKGKLVNTEQTVGRKSVGKKLGGMLTKQQPPRMTTKDRQIKVEPYCRTSSASAMHCSTLETAQRFSEDADHGKLHPVSPGWNEEGKCRKEGAVYNAGLQRVQFCNIMSMDCYPRWSIS